MSWPGLVTEAMRQTCTAGISLWQPRVSAQHMEMSLLPPYPSHTILLNLPGVRGYCSFVADLERLVICSFRMLIYALGGLVPLFCLGSLFCRRRNVSLRAKVCHENLSMKRYRTNAHSFIEVTERLQDANPDRSSLNARYIPIQ